MRRTALLAAVALAVGGGATGALAATGSTAAVGSATGVRGSLPPAPPGMPAGVPAAAREPEPVLPVPRGWPFGEAFPRTSGTGRLAGGAAFWSDFVYDDHGATGHPVQGSPADLAPADGTYTYADPRAHGDGADIFRAAVGHRGGATYWRVDWNTLVDPALPVAEWALDTDGSTATGASAWPAGAGVSSPGIDAALVVSSRGARLLRGDGRLVATLPTTVDRRAQSFVVRVPDRLLRPAGTWRVRLAAGVANAAGTGFAPVGAAQGANPGQPAVYNVAFRSYRQEPPQYRHGTATATVGAQSTPRLADEGNFWMEDHQADALTHGDVSAFSLTVRWADLDHRRTTPEPLPTGYSNRWYVTTLHLGQGALPDSGDDLRPNVLGRVQPYAVYVPTSYDPSHPTPLTWVLHSLGEQHNQYGALAPQQLQQECEDRQSICATPLGFGPDGWYLDEAEVDFWQVWRELAKAYRLDPDRTVISGYSMGGYGTYKLGLEYPDLFAKAMALAGPPQCGLRLTEGLGGAAGPGRCTTDGDTTPLLDSARHLPLVVGQGTLDELVPVSSVLQQVQDVDALGYRYHFELFPAEDHLLWGTQDGFSTLVAQLGSPVRERDPAHVTYTWYPHLSRADLGIGPTGAYWLRDLVARDAAPGALAHVDAVSARGEPAVAVRRSRSANVPGDPTPSLVQDLTWRVGPLPPGAHRMTLTLRDVAALTVEGGPAGLLRRTAMDVRTDGPTVLTLTGLRPGTRLAAGGGTLAVAGRDGRAVLRLGAGRTLVAVIP